MDIHKGWECEQKIMNRLLFDGFDNFGLQMFRFMVELTQCDSERKCAQVIIASVYDEAFVLICSKL
jgi:dipeptidase D